MLFDLLNVLIGKIFFFTGMVQNKGTFPKPLSPEDEKKYLELLKNGDEEARNILIEHNLRLVAHIVKKYNGAEEADDLISVGSLGLIKAINSYKLNHGTQFSTYAAKCIENEILMLLRVNKKHKNTISIEDVLGSDDDENELALEDIMADENEDVEKNVNNAILSEKLNIKLKATLTKREYQIICMRYGLNGMPALTQREVAAKLKISRSYISRLEKKALEDMREVLSEKEFKP